MDGEMLINTLKLASDLELTPEMLVREAGCVTGMSAAG
jgi:hypothetical protein